MKKEHFYLTISVFTLIFICLFVHYKKAELELYALRTEALSSKKPFQPMEFPKQETPKMEEPRTPIGFKQENKG
jgi:hypothetical protein